MQETLWDEWWSRIKSFPSRPRGRIPVGSLNTMTDEKKMHLADRLLRSFPAALPDVEKALPLLRKIEMQDLFRVDSLSVS